MTVNTDLIELSLDSMGKASAPKSEAVNIQCPECLDLDNVEGLRTGQCAK